MAHACAGADERSVLLTVAESERDVASVARNERGRYRVFHVAAGSVTQLSHEYSNSAIPLDAHGFAYWNGTGLVVQRGPERQHFAMGRFGWGPPSVAADPTGRFVMATRWKGDDRKLFWVDVTSGIAQTSKFSYFSYLPLPGAVLYATAHDVKKFDLETGQSVTLTTKAFRRAVLDLLGVPRAVLESGHFSLGCLTFLDGAPVAVFHVFDEHRRYANAAVRFDEGGPRDVLLASEAGWAVQSLHSDGSTAVATLARYESTTLVETKVRGFGLAAARVEAGWWPLRTSALPDFGFQFLP